jgi:HEAT repeat protein
VKFRLNYSLMLLVAMALLPCAQAKAQEKAEQKIDPEKLEQQRDEYLKRVDARNVYELVDALDNPVYRERAQATLVKIGPPAVKPLLEKMDDPKVQNARVLAETLGLLGPAAKETWPVLLKKTRIKDHDLVTVINKALLSNSSDVVPTLVAGLKDPDSAIRTNSARLLSQLGPLAEKAVPNLRAVLQTKGEATLVRFWTFIALAEIGPPSEPALQELLTALNQIEEKDRYLPARALGSIGPPARAAVPRFIKMIKERTSIQNTEAAAQGLVNIGTDAVPALSEMLRDKSKDRAPRELASQCLVQIGRPAVPHLLALLSDSDLVVAERAAIILLQIGEPAVADMVELSRTTTDAELQFTLAQILARLPAASSMAVPGLIVGLQDRDPFRRLTAAQALADSGPAALQALPALLNSLRLDLDVAARRYGPGFPDNYVSTVGRALVAGGEGAILPLHQAMIDKNLVVRNVAAQAMANLGMEYKTQVVPRMVGSLLVQNPHLHDLALQTLASIDPSSVSMARLGPKAIPALTEAVRFGTPELRDKAAMAMVMLGEKSVMPLVECMVEPDLSVRLISVRALGALKEKAAPAITALAGAAHYKAEMEATPDADKAKWQEYSQSVAIALGSIGEPAIPKLLELLQEDDPDIRLLAAGGLSHMGKKATPAVPGLRECLHHKNIEVRVSALSALNRIGPGAVEAAPDLLLLLRNIETSFRGLPHAVQMRKGYAKLIAETLGKMGDGVLPLLLPLIQDPDENVRVHVCYALWKEDFKTKDIEKIAPPLQEQLNAALLDKSLVVRVVAARAVAGLGITGGDSIPNLLEAVRTSSDVMNDAQFKDMIIDDYLPALVDAFDSIGQPAVEPLVEVAKGDDEAMRGVAAWALFRIAPDASQLVDLGEGAIPVLINSIQSDDTSFSNRAADALIELGDPAVKALLQAQKEHGSTKGDAVQRTLARMYETSAQALVDAMEDEDPVIRSAAARALGGPQPAGPKAIPVSTAIDALTKALEDEDPGVQASAQHSLFWLDKKLAISLGVEDPGKKLTWQEQRSTTTLLEPAESESPEDKEKDADPFNAKPAASTDSDGSKSPSSSSGAPVSP